jgi:prepilin-type N-terminal cleavage/methylation domain-containing protein
MTRPPNPLPARLALGFSLVELMLTLAIIALLSAIAVPRIANSAAGSRASAAAQRIAADLNMARSRANITSTALTVTFTFATNQYQIPGIPDLVQPTSTYTVNLADEPYRAVLTSTTFTGSTQTTGAAQLSFNGYGVPSSGGTITISSGNASKVITIDAGSGRAQVQ